MRDKRGSSRIDMGRLLRGEQARDWFTRIRTRRMKRRIKGRETRKVLEWWSAG